MRRLLTLTIAAALGATAVLPTTAFADRVQHSQHIELHAVDDAPLHKGFVENIHANGPQVYAQEIYQLNGAAPSSDFAVTIYAHPFDTSCTTAEPVVIPTSSLATNGAGNGQGRATIRPEDVEGFPRGTHGVLWEITDGTHTYVTDCTPVNLD